MIILLDLSSWVLSCCSKAKVFNRVAGINCGQIYGVLSFSYKFKLKERFISTQVKYRINCWVIRTIRVVLTLNVKWTSFKQPSSITIAWNFFYCLRVGTKTKSARLNPNTIIPGILINFIKTINFYIRLTNSNFDYLSNGTFVLLIEH